MRQSMFIVLGCALLALLAPGSALAQTAPTLTGEVLFGFNGVDTSGTTCSESGSTVQFTTSGPASGIGPFDNPDPALGPYPGTFTASGTVTAGPNTAPNPFGNGTVSVGTILSVTENFTILSGSDTITGTKSLEAVLPGQFLYCADATIPPPAPNAPSPVHIRSAQIANLRYEATITTPDGQFIDRGSSLMQLDDTVLLDFPVPFPIFRSADRFREFFTSDLTTATPLCNQNDQNNQNQGGNGQGCVNP